MSFESKVKFTPRNEIVGWNNLFHGSSRPVTGVVVGRNALGLLTTPIETLVRVETFIKATGNGYILENLPNSIKNDNGTFSITDDFSLEYAMKLDYSTPEKNRLFENVPCKLENALNT
jgi:hypothetical protein